MLRRVDLLINSRIRQETDTKDSNAITDYEILEYLNNGQRLIQNIIYQAGSDVNIFTKSVLYNTTPNTLEYDLPSDIFASGSVVSLHSVENTNRIVQTYRRVNYRERSLVFGYAIQGNKFILSADPVSSSSQLLLRYNRKLPTLSKRMGTIDSVSGQILTLSDVPFPFEITDEYVSIVDKKGVITHSGLYIEEFLSSGSLTVEGDITTTAPTVGNFIVFGQYGTTHSDHPPEVENYLIEYVKRHIFARLKSRRISDSSVFTQQERIDMTELFGNPSPDPQGPNLTDMDFLEY